MSALEIYLTVTAVGGWCTAGFANLFFGLSQTKCRVGLLTASGLCWINAALVIWKVLER